MSRFWKQSTEGPSAVPCCWGLTRPKQLPMVVTVWVIELCVSWWPHHGGWCKCVSTDTQNWTSRSIPGAHNQVRSTRHWGYMMAFLQTELFLDWFPFPGWGPFLESPETFRAPFGWHNSLCIFKTKASRGKKLDSYFNFYSLYNIWKDQLYSISGS